jgi:hypothetical protein
MNFRCHKFNCSMNCVQLCVVTRGGSLLMLIILLCLCATWIWTLLLKFWGFLLFESSGSNTIWGFCLTDPWEEVWWLVLTKLQWFTTLEHRFWWVWAHLVAVEMSRVAVGQDHVPATTLPTQGPLDQNLTEFIHWGAVCTPKHDQHSTSIH